MPYRRHVESSSSKFLEFIALLLTLAILLVLVIAGYAFLRTQDMHVFVWCSPVLTGFGAALSILLKTIYKKCR